MWNNRNLSWAKLIIVWSGVYLLLISLVSNKLPWYMFPIYPSLALAFGFQLAQTDSWPLLSTYPRTWFTGFACLAVVATAGSVYFSWGSAGKIDLQMILTATALTMTLAAILVERNDGQFFQILVWGSYISLLLLMKSNYWVWELGEAYPVKPVAQMIAQANPATKEIYTSFPYHRPSLDFYSDRTIIPVRATDLQHYWLYSGQTYFLVNQSDLKQLQLPFVKVIGQAGDWQLITKHSDGQTTLL
jgi:4-amino-4-deoxy-L-arabinose transferase-like glycosyltransferase